MNTDVKHFLSHLVVHILSQLRVYSRSLDDSLALVMDFSVFSLHPETNVCNKSHASVNQ